MCRRRQILDHFGDDAEGAPTGRCCDVCDPDRALEQAIGARLTATGRRPGRRATAGARAAASDPSALSGTWAGQAGGADEAAGEPVDEEEFEKLRRWRWERAEGKPAFTVAANAVLEEVLRRRPRDVAELIEIRGIGPAFCEKHGESLLGALEELAGAPSGDSGGRVATGSGGATGR